MIRTVTEVTRLLPNALRPRTRGGGLTGNCPGDAPETGTGSSVSATFAPMHL